MAIASLFANRGRPEVQRTVGFLVNLLLLRVRLPVEATFAEIVGHCQRTCAGAVLHADVPYHALSPPPAGVPGRADDVVFHVAAERIDRSLTTGLLQLHALVPDVVGRFDVELALMPAGAELTVRLTHNASRLATPVATKLLRDYVATASLAAAAPDEPVSALGA